MDYGNAELCSQCGETMFVIPNPSPEMLQASPGYQVLKEKTIAITGGFEEEDIRIAFCDTCNVTAFIGARVSISGVIKDMVIGDD